jgi:hypothetical protein
LKTLNNLLIAIFEKTLSGFESNGISYNADTIKKIINEYSREIEGIRLSPAAWIP